MAIEKSKWETSKKCSKKPTTKDLPRLAAFLHREGHSLETVALLLECCVPAVQAYIAKGSRPPKKTRTFYSAPRKVTASVVYRVVNRKLKPRKTKGWRHRYFDPYLPKPPTS